MELTKRKLLDLCGCCEAVDLIDDCDNFDGSLPLTPGDCKRFIELFEPRESDKLTSWESITYWLVTRYYHHRPWEGYFGGDMWIALSHLPTKKRAFFLCHCLESLVTGDLWTDEINGMIVR